MMKTVKEHNIKADDVAEIKVEVIARAADILGDPHKHRPDSKETADHSLPYCMAAGLVDGIVTPLQFKEELIPELKDTGLVYFSPIVKLRQMFNLHTNMRPCKSYPGNPLYKQPVRLTPNRTLVLVLAHAIYWIDRRI